MGLFRNHKTKKEHRSRSLFQSLCVSMASIVLSLIMLVGTTMAWFTDSVTTGTSTIVAGNIGSGSSTSYLTQSATATGYAMSTSQTPTWRSLSELQDSTTLFDPDTHFTPGVAQTVYLQLSNDGTLKTQYRIYLQLVAETGGLSNCLMYGYKVFDGTDTMDEFYCANRAAAENYTKSDSLALHHQDAYAAQDTTCVLELAPEEQKCMALSIFMPESTAITELVEGASVSVRLTLVTTQIGEEGAPPEAWDSVTVTASEQLEKPEGTENTYNINSPADLAGIANVLKNEAVQTSLSSVTLNLTTDIDMNDEAWTPIDTTIPVKINGNGHTIYNLNASGEGLTNAGLFGSAQTLTVTSLNFVGGKAEGTISAGMLAGNVVQATLTAVNVENVTVQAPSGSVNPLVGTGTVTQNNCNASNYTTSNP